MIPYGFSKEEIESMGKMDNFWKICIVWLLIYILAFGVISYYAPEQPEQEQEN